MALPSEHQGIRSAAGRLRELLDLGPDQPEVQLHPGPEGPDAVIDAGGTVFVVEWKSSGSAVDVAMAADQASRCARELGKTAVPLVVVPFMGTVGRERCDAAGVAWLDLSGNAEILAPGIRVHVEGKPNRFKRRGRPASAFAPKSSRIARWLLMHPNESATQREIARAAAVDEGYTSRIVSRLEADHLVVREPDGAIRVRDPDLLLDAWREEYEFSKHRIVRGHAAARSGDVLLRQLGERLRTLGTPYAATGLGAAWLLTRFAGFRIATFFLPEVAERDVLRDLEVREAVEGANVWLVAPNDEGVLHGATDREGICCVHPVQAYLDLTAHPERAEEATKELRTRLLTWTCDG